MYFKQLLIMLISCVMVACAGTSEQADSETEDIADRGRDCIHEPSIRGYTVLDEQNLIVRAGGRRHYHVVLSRRAQRIQFSHGIWFKTTTSRVCAGFDTLHYEDSFTGGIRIETIRELSELEEEHLLIQFGKKEPEIEQMPAPQDVEGADIEELDETASE